MAKICEICGKNIGMLGSTYTIKAINSQFEGYHNCTSCLECSDAINRTQDIVSKGISYPSDKQSYTAKLKPALEGAAQKNANEKRKKSLLLLIEKADEVADNFVAPEPKVNEEPVREEPAEVTIDETIYGTPLYVLHGCRGRHLFVYEDYIVIKTVVTIGSVITGNVTDGEKVIFYKDCIGIQYKEPRFTIGYIQLETASAQMNNLGSNQFNENTFTFEIDTDNIKPVYKYILDKVIAIKK